MAQEWQPVEAAAKNDKGEYMAQIGGVWKPVAGAAKNAEGKYMALMETPSKPVEKPVETTKDKSILSKAGDVALGTLETPISLATGMGATALGGIAQAGTAAYEAGKEILGGERTPGAAQAVGKEVSEKFTYHPKSESGKSSVGAVGEVLSGFGLAPAIAEKMRQTERELTGGRTTATDIGLGALAAAPMAGKVNPEKVIHEERTKLYGKDVADAGQFMDKGFKIAPHEIKAGEHTSAAKLAEKIGSEKGISDAVSFHNQETANVQARKGIGLKPDERITPEAIKEKRDEAYKPYEDIKNYGAEQGLKFKFDKQLYDDISKISSDITGSALAKERPTAESVVKTRNAVRDVQNEIFGGNKGTLSPAATIELIRDLRERSSDIYKKRDVGTDERRIAEVQYQAANALENMLERRLTESGQKGMVNNFKEARKKLSQLHVYSEILNPETGNVNMRKLTLKKYEKAPLTDELADLRKFATKYRDSSKPEFAQRQHGVSPLEAGLMAAELKHRPLGAVMLGARALARPALTSEFMQRKAIPSLEKTPVSGRVASAATSRTAALTASAIAEKKRKERQAELARLRRENYNKD